jgi:hypothetical protein
MLLDAVNTPFSDQGYARRQMLSFVQKQYKPGEKMAIFTLTASAGQLVTALLQELPALVRFQAPSPPPGEVPAPTKRVSTHLVLVDVVVTDKATLKVFRMKSGNRLTLPSPGRHACQRKQRQQRPTPSQMRVHETASLGSLLTSPQSAAKVSTFLGPAQVICLIRHPSLE